MVKLFGWEKKMSEQIDEKRVEELKVVRQLKLFRGLNGSLKYVLLMIIPRPDYSHHLTVVSWFGFS